MTCMRLAPIHSSNCSLTFDCSILGYPVDDLLIAVRRELEETDMVSNAVEERTQWRTSAARCRSRNGISGSTSR